MKIYLDLIFFLNFSFDFLLLLTVKLLLHRNCKLLDLFLGALLGSMSVCLLFFPINSITLFFFKVCISILMILVSFGFHNLSYTLYNVCYLYSASFLLGGALYALNVQFSYRQQGLIFYHRGLGINLIFLILVSPIFVYTYIKQERRIKHHYHHYYEVTLMNHGKSQELRGFLDTGNQVYDPFFHAPVLLVSRKSLTLPLPKKSKIYVPIDTANGHNLLPCFLIDQIYIKDVGYRKHVRLGILEDEIPMDGIDCILSEAILEGGTNETNHRKN